MIEKTKIRVKFVSERKSEAIWFNVKEVDVVPDDFTAMFAKQATGGARSTSSTSLNASSLGGAGAGNKPECVKLLDSKRSQALGILISSKRLDAHIVRDALLNFDKYLLS